MNSIRLRLLGVTFCFACFIGLVASGARAHAQEVVLLYRADITQANGALANVIVPGQHEWIAELRYDLAAVDEAESLSLGSFPILGGTFAIRDSAGADIFSGVATGGTWLQNQRITAGHLGSELGGSLADGPSAYPLRSVQAVWSSPVLVNPDVLESVPPILFSSFSFAASFRVGAQDQSIQGVLAEVRWVCPNEQSADDADADGIPDECDPCDGFANTNLLADADGDGAPNECQCGDADGNGFVQYADVLRTAMCFDAPASCTLDPTLVDLAGDPAQVLLSMSLAASVQGGQTFLTCARRPDGNSPPDSPFQP